MDELQRKMLEELSRAMAQSVDEAYMREAKLQQERATAAAAEQGRRQRATKLFEEAPGAWMVRTIYEGHVHHFLPGRTIAACGLAFTIGSEEMMPPSFATPEHLHATATIYCRTCLRLVFNRELRERKELGNAPAEA